MRKRLQSADASPIVAVSSQMVALLRVVERAAVSEAKVLITGESGVGKDLVAQRIHMGSPRAGRPWLAVNCAGLTESLLESELFGHVRGSFTGAYRDKVGKLQAAHTGTIFLDEVAEMSLRMQAMLLRFLENGEIQAVGSEARGSKVDVRVIAATNRNLPELIAAGQFREDLLYRLRVIHLEVLPLRERREDIRPLIAHFIERAQRRVTFTEDALALLVRYRWSGNVRELQNVVEQAIWLADGDVVDIAQLPESIRTSAQAVLPLRERRRQISDELYNALVNGGYSFWDHIYPLFLSRDITRHDMRELVRRGLAVTRGNYRAMLKLFGIPNSDYKRFLNSLAAHDCSSDFREFRDGVPPEPRRAPLVLPPLAPGQPDRSGSVKESSGPSRPAGL